MGIFQIESRELFVQLASNYHPPDLSLSSSWDYKSDSQAPDSLLFYIHL
jgi:hypothetical protein